MIRSMTGFGDAVFEVEDAAFAVELRTVNHRHLDLRARLPRGLAALEGEVRSWVQGRLSRGKVDLTVRGLSGATGAERLELDLEAAGRYLQAARELEARHGVGGELDVRSLLSLPGVARLVERELPEALLRPSLREGVERALAAAEAMRAAEGEALDRELRARLTRIEELGDAVASRASEVQRAVRERLRKRAEQLRDETGLLDEARLHQEIVLAADRLDVTEEVVRLRSHLEQFRAALESAGPGQPVGRRLDFLLQELGREVNTIGSKGGDAPVAHFVVDLKTELERVREQVQNVE